MSRAMRSPWKRYPNGMLEIASRAFSADSRYAFRSLATPQKRCYPIEDVAVGKGCLRDAASSAGHGLRRQD
jgi:hypothetical protein